MSVKSIILLVLISNSLSYVEIENSASYDILNSDDGLGQGFLHQKYFQEAFNDNKNNFIKKISQILDLGKRPEIKSPEQHLHRSSIKYLYTLYEILKNNNDRNRIRNTRSVTNTNFITDFDLIEVEKSNNIITFAPIKSNKYLCDSKNHFKLRFNINDIPKKFVLKSSELRIYKNLSSELFHNIDQISIEVYLVGNIEDKRIPITSNNININYVGWLEIDITVAVRKLISNDRLNPTLQIDVHLKNDSQILIDPMNIGLVAIDNNNEEFHPFIIGLFNGPEIIDNFKTLVQQKVERVKRNIDPITVGHKNDKNNRKILKTRNQRQLKTNRQDAKHYSSQMTINEIKQLHQSVQQFKTPKFCQRMNFTVDFYELNWENWIIAPEKFDAYFCSGECNFPLGAGMNATNHALIQTLMRLKQPWLPKPCCAPRDLGSISVLYHLNEQNVNLRKYKHMVAYDCGCH